MKRKMTILLFGLLLAVGWTSDAQAQLLPSAQEVKLTSPGAIIKAPNRDRAVNPDYLPAAVKPFNYYAGLTYSWSDPTTGESGIDVPATDEATNPYQIYELLRFVYRDKRFPGPTYSAWADDGETPEDPVYYGAIGGGWNLTTGGMRDLIITTTSTYVNIRSISVYAGNSTSGTPITSWNATQATAGYDQDGTNTYYYYALPTGWTSSRKLYRVNLSSYGTTYVGYMTTGGTITIDKSLFEGQSSVTVVINGNVDSGNESESFIVDGVTWLPNSTTLTNHSWNINLASNPSTDVEAPEENGYTVLVVKLKNNLSLIDESPNSAYDKDCYFNDKDSLISYLGANIKSVKLLTDGLRIGEGENIGTVFNCSGNYNRFFFLGKGQARKKNGLVQALEQQNGRVYGEEVPFKSMFEQFSPTSDRVDTTSQTTDFYSKMMQGKVYQVIHDCPSVIQNQHYFSMSGRNGKDDYAMSGMNFFIPDFRLKKWAKSYTYKYYYNNGYYSGSQTYTVDGRDQSPIMDYDDNTFPYYNERYGMNVNYSYFGSWWAVYDTLDNHGPKVGLYLLELHAQAVQDENYSTTNRLYDVNLDWTSSLNQMSGTEVPQTYVLYIVNTDENGNERLDSVTTVDTDTEWIHQDTIQRQHSYSITYILKGSPTDSDHPGFVAWSRPVTVIIPGYDDFMELKLHHYESDFVVPEDYILEPVKNYYRNYLQPKNDIANGLTANSIKAGNDSFILYRNSTDGKYPVCKLKFAVNSQNKVLYKIEYFNQDTDGPNNINIEQIINSLVNN